MHPLNASIARVTILLVLAQMFASTTRTAWRDWSAISALAVSSVFGHCLVFFFLSSCTVHAERSKPNAHCAKNCRIAQQHVHQSSTLALLLAPPQPPLPRYLPHSSLR
jgi:hypothetical protein